MFIVYTTTAIILCAHVSIVSGAYEEKERTSRIIKNKINCTDISC